MSQNEMIDQAARAAAKAMGYDFDQQDRGDPNTPMQDDLREAVRAVLQSFREPSEAMKAAGGKQTGNDGWHVEPQIAAWVWERMIDVALDPDQ